MVPGQSMILYSRLHLICQNDRLLRFLFWFIIINSILLCTPTITLNWGQYTKNPAPFTCGYAVMEKIQVSVFAFQETVITCIYFFEIRRVLQMILDHPTRRIMWRLVAMNIMLLVLNAALLTTEFLDLYMIQTTFKSMVYSIKLKVEMATLSQIVSVFQERSRPNSLVLAINTALPDSTNGGGTVDTEENGGENGQAVGVLQTNIPPEWRLSISSAERACPSLLEIERARVAEESPTYSLSSVEKMYPGRLGNGSA